MSEVVRPIAKPLLKWFDEFGRKNLPWQAKPPNPYHVWLSEVMLQQTQAATVIDYFNRFIKTYPTLKTLAAADEELVLALWAGLGYYIRAHNLHKAAKIIIAQHQGKLPTEFAALVALPGIGESTAGAILAISFNQHHAILDGNVKRVIARYHQVNGHHAQSSTLKQLWRLAKIHTPQSRCADYTQAIMDLGATLCTRSKPDCVHCPLALHCQAKIYNTQAEYPNPKPKKTKPTKKIAMLIFRNQAGEVYLEKRPSKGIWGGLWSFKECEDNPKAISIAINRFDKNAQAQQSLSVFKHSFTHYHLLIHPIVVDYTNSRHRFYNVKQQVLGMPAPVGKILAQLNSAFA